MYYLTFTQMLVSGNQIPHQQWRSDWLVSVQNISYRTGYIKSECITSWQLNCSYSVKGTTTGIYFPYTREAELVDTRAEDGQWDTVYLTWSGLTAPRLCALRLHDERACYLRNGCWAGGKQLYSSFRRLTRIESATPKYVSEYVALRRSSYRGSSKLAISLSYPSPTILSTDLP